MNYTIKHVEEYTTIMGKLTLRMGLYASTVSFIAAAGYGIVQVMQVAGTITYPLDARLIYGFSLGIAAPYLLGLLALHYSAPGTRKIWTAAALLFGVMYNVFVTIMYAVQLATVIPQSLKDPSETILTVTPHSFFWTLDALGYICFGISTLFAAFVFQMHGLARWVRVFFIANGCIVPIIAWVYFYPHFSIALLFLGSPWIIAATGSLLLLALFFRSLLREKI